MTDHNERLGDQHTVAQAKAEAWHEGYVAACEHYACDTVFDERPVSPYESGADR